MTAPAITRQQAVDELLSETCKGCGAAKKSGMSHCRRCYFKLPRAMRSKLYRRVGDGYEQAYAESLALLGKAEA